MPPTQKDPVSSTSERPSFDKDAFNTTLKTFLAEQSAPIDRAAQVRENTEKAMNSMAALQGIHRAFEGTTLAGKGSAFRQVAGAHLANARASIERVLEDAHGKARAVLTPSERIEKLADKNIEKAAPVLATFGYSMGPQHTFAQQQSNLTGSIFDRLAEQAKKQHARLQNAPRHVQAKAYAPLQNMKAFGHLVAQRAQKVSNIARDSLFKTSLRISSFLSSPAAQKFRVGAAVAGVALAITTATMPHLSGLSDALGELSRKGTDFVLGSNPLNADYFALNDPSTLHHLTLANASLDHGFTTVEAGEVSDTLANNAVNKIANTAHLNPTLIPQPTPFDYTALNAPPAEVDHQIAQWLSQQHAVHSHLATSSPAHLATVTPGDDPKVTDALNAASEHQAEIGITGHQTPAEIHAAWEQKLGDSPETTENAAKAIHSLGAKGHVASQGQDADKFPSGLDVSVEHGIATTPPPEATLTQDMQVLGKNAKKLTGLSF